MRSVVAVVSLALVMGGCASQPKATMLALNHADPAYASADCMQARDAALAYNDNAAGRAGVGLVMGLLGPIGLIGAVAMDVNQNTERKQVNEIVTRACTTPSAPVAETTPEPQPRGALRRPE